MVEEVGVMEDVLVGRDTPFPESVPSGWCGWGERGGIKGGRGGREGREGGRGGGRKRGREEEEYAIRSNPIMSNGHLYWNV